jgi:hypothetical protein
MLTDIVNYYPSNNRDFLPFIIAPIDIHQNVLLCAPQEIAKEQSSFIAIASKSSNDEQNSIQFRVFSYKRYVATTVTFPTSLCEQSSGRSGLDLIIGALIERAAFSRYERPINSYLPQFIHQIETIWFLRLFEGDASRLINELNDEMQNDVQVKMSQVYRLMLEGNILSMRRRGWWEGVLWRRRAPHDCFPRLVFTNAANNSMLFENWCEIMDAHIRTVKNLNFDVSNKRGIDITVQVINIPELGKEKITKVKLFSSPKTHIAVW